MESTPARILIVDDIPENIELLHFTLRSDGYLFSIATSAREAFEVVETESPDLILLDVMLPDMDGFEICQQLKMNPKTAEIPIIFLTARADTKDKIKGLDLGAVDYITKPFDESEVIARVRTHLRLRRTEELLRAANATKDKMFAVITHDVRGPIGNIKSALDLVVEDFHSYRKNEILELLNVLRSTSGSTYYLIENLLHWARSESGKMLYCPENIKIKEIVDETLSLLSNIALNKTIRIQSTIPDSCVVFADNMATTIIFRNLVSNAIKFTNDKGEILLSCQKKDNNFWEFVVKDTGIGIEDENLSRIFTNNNVSRAGTAKEQGTGLGLLICKEFVVKNGGNIYAQRNTTGGTSFLFTLPTEK